MLLRPSHPRRLLPGLSRIVGVSVLLGCVAGCSGSGGGGVNASDVTLSYAVFAGATPTDRQPDPGDGLLLYFNGDVSLISGKILDDGDLALSAGSLGTGITAPLQIDSRTIRITLGTDVSFTPDTDTIRLRKEQDAVQDLLGRKAVESPAITVTVTDGDRPVVESLNLNGVPTALNGTGAAGGTLQVPRSGFTVDATYRDATSAIPANGLNVTASVAVRNQGNTLPAGTNLAPLLVGTPGPTSFSLAVPATLEFPDGDQTLALTVTDVTNNMSAPLSFSFRVQAINDDLRPFEPSAHANQVWFLDTSRDLDTITSSPGGGGAVTLSLTAVPNGLSDFLEELLILGLRSPTPVANVLPGKDSNDVVLDLLQAELGDRLDELHPDIRIVFTWTEPGPFPAGRALVPYRDASHSRIAIGAANGLSGAGAGAVGIALYDPSNRTQDNNTLPPGSYDGVVIQTRLGVFPHTLVASSINLVGSQFYQTFSPFVDHRGTPIGEDAGDATRLVNLTNSTAGDGRQSAMRTAIDGLARFVAVIVAHECGHSVGLVKDGAMPTGLYGGDPTNFPGSTEGHIDLGTNGLFPPGASEVMSPILSYPGTLHPQTAFNPLILAYLRERVLYNN